MDRWSLALAAVEAADAAPARRALLRQELRDKRAEHRRHVEEYGEDLPEIRSWRWGAVPAAPPPAPVVLVDRETMTGALSRLEAPNLS